MKFKAGKFFCCMAVGTVMGCAAGLICASAAPKASGALCAIKKKAAKMLRQMGSIADAIGYFLK